MNEEILKAKVRSMRKGEWYWVHHLVLDRYGRQLGPYGIAVYTALCRFASQEQMAFPSQKLIGERIGASRSKVAREMKKLQRLGLIWVAKRDGCRNLYFLLGLSGYPVENRKEDVFHEDTGCLPVKHPMGTEETETISKKNNN
jgi:hypothetical protein